MPRKKKDEEAPEAEAPKEEAVIEKPSRIPEGQDPHEFREKLQRALDAAPAGSMKSATYKKALKEVDEYIETLPEPPKADGGEPEDAKEEPAKP